LDIEFNQGRIVREIARRLFWLLWKKC
jgi:hypothetical protein